MTSLEIEMMMMQWNVERVNVEDWMGELFRGVS